MPTTNKSAFYWHLQQGSLKQKKVYWPNFELFFFTFVFWNFLNSCIDLSPVEKNTLQNIVVQLCLIKTPEKIGRKCNLFVQNNLSNMTVAETVETITVWSDINREYGRKTLETSFRVLRYLERGENGRLKSHNFLWHWRKKRVNKSYLVRVATRFFLKKCLVIYEKKCSLKSAVFLREMLQTNFFARSCQKVFT